MEKLFLFAASAVFLVVVLQLHLRKKQKIQAQKARESISNLARKAKYKPELARLNMIDLDLDVELD